MELHRPVISLKPKLGIGNGSDAAGFGGSGSQYCSQSLRAGLLLRSSGRWQGMKRDEKAGTPPWECYTGGEDQCGDKTEACSIWEEEGILWKLKGRKAAKQGIQRSDGIRSPAQRRGMKVCRHFLDKRCSPSEELHHTLKQVYPLVPSKGCEEVSSG